VLDRHQKTEYLQGLDVLSVPATYDEPKGIFLLEAMANGVLECADDVDAAIDESPPENSFTRRRASAKRTG
jgi:glycosyltransferase involved in cell wall biosynthesis